VFFKGKEGGSAGGKDGRIQEGGDSLFYPGMMIFEKVEKKKGGGGDLVEMKLGRKTSMGT